jgi:hypothetical protein
LIGVQPAVVPPDDLPLLVSYRTHPRVHRHCGAPQRSSDRGDTGPGMAKGQGSKAFGADWYVLNAKGSKIDDD